MTQLSPCLLRENSDVVSLSCNEVFVLSFACAVQCVQPYLLCSRPISYLPARPNCTTWYILDSCKKWCIVRFTWHSWFSVQQNVHDARVSSSCHTSRSAGGPGTCLSLQSYPSGYGGATAPQALKFLVSEGSSFGPDDILPGSKVLLCTAPYLLENSPVAPKTFSIASPYTHRVFSSDYFASDLNVKEHLYIWCVPAGRPGAPPGRLCDGLVRELCEIHIAPSFSIDIALHPSPWLWRILVVHFQCLCLTHVSCIKIVLIQLTYMCLFLRGASQAHVRLESLLRQSMQIRFYPELPLWPRPAMLRLDLFRDQPNDGWESCSHKNPDGDSVRFRSSVLSTFFLVVQLPIFVVLIFFFKTSVLCGSSLHVSRDETIKSTWSEFTISLSCSSFLFLSLCPASSTCFLQCVPSYHACSSLPYGVIFFLFFFVSCQS